MRLHLIIVIFSISCIWLACQSSSSEKAVVAVTDIHLFEKPEDNLQTAKDLAAFNFRELVQVKLNIQDTSILNAIFWEYSKQENAAGVNLQLLLTEKALPYKKDLEALFRQFVQEKLLVYKEKKVNLSTAESAADAYVRLIAVAPIDTVWPKTSPNLKKFASKEDFNLTLKRRKMMFHPVGKRKIESRRVSTSIGSDLKGDFCTITFVYENREQEEVTMEKINGQYTLLGYRFLVIPH